MVIFTSVCLNYIHKARTLAESVKLNIPDATFVVCLLEREAPVKKMSTYFDLVVLAKGGWEGNFNQFIFKHTIVEASTSVKGQFFRYLYNLYPEENKFIYLDPDIYVYSDFSELRMLLENRPIILCPHLLEPGNIDMELSSTAHGVYNLGFLAVNRSIEAKKFIDWWAERLYMFCYEDISKGIFTDQKWIELAPCFFDVEILKHRGYDFATWSLLNCNMEEINGQVYVKGAPLRFIHYSGYGEVLDKCIREWLPDGDHPFKRLYKQYSAIHDANDFDGISKTRWSYGTYLSGEKIWDRARRVYRSDNNLMLSTDDPFNKNNRYFIRKSKLYKLSSNYAKAKNIIRTKGFRKFCKMIWKKISHCK